MNIPFDNNLIDNRINGFTRYLDIIINCPTISFSELTQTISKRRGLYLIFDNNELVYVGMTESSHVRFTYLTSSYTKHTFNRKRLAEYLRGKDIYRKNGDTIHIISNKIKDELIRENIITAEQFKAYRKEVNEMIKTFKFKFYETDLIDLKDFEHFAIAILNPTYND